MPSDDKKKRDAKKKEARKQQQQRGKGLLAAAADSDDGSQDVDVEQNTDANDSGVAENGLSTSGLQNGTNGVDHISDQLAKAELEKADARCVTGVLLSQKESRDLHIGQLTVLCFGQVLIEDGLLEMNNGRRYGLLGLNGCGKSTLLSLLAHREVPIPEHFDIYLLQEEMPPSDMTPLEAVVSVDKERLQLEHESERLALNTDEESQERLQEIYERLDLMDADRAVARAGAILHGLGFKKDQMQKKVREFSGGWRMRIALARALFVRPRLLLLDEPTNHLDLATTVWLEQELSSYKSILVIISHSQDFLNNVCTNIIHIHQRKLKYYTGNYDQYVQTRMELETSQMKKYKWEQNRVADIKDFVARFGHGTKKLARQAQSREKMLARMVESGLTEAVTKDKNIAFHFPDCGKLPPPVLMVQDVSFRYADGQPLIYSKLEFGFDLDSRVALVGPNGAGKSTLLKLLYGGLNPSSGLIRRHSHLKLVHYHQHLQEMLDLEAHAIDWMQSQFPNIKEIDEIRKMLGRFGLTGAQQTSRMRVLSDGQRSRVVFAWMAQQAPHILLLDEPTNHLDMETIDALADALNDYEGGVILVSHDFRLISQVADEIWLCDKMTVKKYDGDIYDYKAYLAKRVQRLKEKYAVKS